jgi:hypothetical protein
LPKPSQKSSSKFQSCPKLPQSYPKIVPDNAPKIMPQSCSPKLLFQNYESTNLFAKIFFPKPFCKTTPENYALKLLPKATPQSYRPKLLFQNYEPIFPNGSPKLFTRKLLLKIAIKSSPKLLVKSTPKVIPQSCCFSNQFSGNLSKLFPKAVPRSYFPKLFPKIPPLYLYKVVPQNTSTKWLP